MLVSRPVIAFALLRQCSEMMRTDLLSGVSVLIRPLISDLDSQVFDSRVLAERLADAYGVSIPPAALEGMTQRLVSANILRLEQTGFGLSRALFCSASESPALDPNAERDFQEVIDDFLRHADERLAAVGKQLPQSALTTGFLRHLATLDFSAIKAKPVITPDELGKTIIGPAAREQQALSVELAEQATLDSLVASYVARLQEHHPARLSLLAKVADGALAAELVFDLQAPTSVSRLTSTIVVVDTPLILSYLDLSSTQDTTDIRKLFEQVHETGAKIAAFEHSIVEAEGVLKAIQNARGAGDAYGPAVHRLSQSTFRAYFESMIGSIGRCWTQSGDLKILPEAAITSQKHFTVSDEDELFGALRANEFDRVLTRERDAKSVAEIIRRLAGGHIPIGNFSSCRFLFVTPNSSLQRRVESFLYRKKYVVDGELTPVLTTRYLAGLCWLMCGGKSDQSPTMARLLANCAAALRLKPELADRTKRFLAATDPEKARHFEVLMTNERASQYLVEATFGDASAITANNVEEIYEEVQRRAAEKVAAEKDNEYGGTILELQAAVREGEESTGKLRCELDATQLEVETRNMELRSLAQRTADLEVERASSLQKIAQQDLQLKALDESAAQAMGTASEVQKLLRQQFERGRKVAAQFADRRTKLLRGIGVLALFGLFFGVGYLDKFVAPHATQEEQSNLAYAIILVQALLGISGVSLLVTPIVRRPVEKLRQRLYQKRLTELGIPEDEFAEKERHD